MKKQRYAISHATSTSLSTAMLPSPLSVSPWSATVDGPRSSTSSTAAATVSHHTHTAASSSLASSSASSSSSSPCSPSISSLNSSSCSSSSFPFSKHKTDIMRNGLYTNMMLLRQLQHISEDDLLRFVFRDRPMRGLVIQHMLNNNEVRYNDDTFDPMYPMCRISGDVTRIIKNNFITSFSLSSSSCIPLSSSSSSSFSSSSSMTLSSSLSASYTSPLPLPYSSTSTSSSSSSTLLTSSSFLHPVSSSCSLGSNHDVSVSKVPFFGSVMQNLPYPILCLILSLLDVNSILKVVLPLHRTTFDYLQRPSTWPRHLHFNNGTCFSNWIQFTRSSPFSFDERLQSCFVVIDEIDDYLPARYDITSLSLSSRSNVKLFSKLSMLNVSFLTPDPTQTQSDFTRKRTFPPLIHLHTMTITIPRFESKFFTLPDSLRFLEIKTTSFKCHTNTLPAGLNVLIVSGFIEATCNLRSCASSLRRLELRPADMLANDVEVKWWSNGSDDGSDDDNGADRFILFPNVTTLLAHRLVYFPPVDYTKLTALATTMSMLLDEEYMSDPYFSLSGGALLPQLIQLCLVVDNRLELEEICVPLLRTPHLVYLHMDCPQVMFPRKELVDIQWPPSLQSFTINITCPSLETCVESISRLFDLCNPPLLSRTRRTTCTPMTTTTAMSPMMTTCDDDFIKEEEEDDSILQARIKPSFKYDGFWNAETRSFYIPPAKKSTSIITTYSIESTEKPVMSPAPSSSSSSSPSSPSSPSSSPSPPQYSAIALHLPTRQHVTSFRRVYMDRMMQDAYDWLRDCPCWVQLSLNVRTEDMIEKGRYAYSSSFPFHVSTNDEDHRKDALQNRDIEHLTSSYPRNVNWTNVCLLPSSFTSYSSTSSSSSSTSSSSSSTSSSSSSSTSSSSSSSDQLHRGCVCSIPYMSKEEMSLYSSCLFQSQSKPAVTVISPSTLNKI